MRQNNTYLYGTEDVPEIPKCIIDRRLFLIERNIAIEHAEPIKTRKQDKLNYLIKARTFWTEMLKNNGGY